MAQLAIPQILDLEYEISLDDEFTSREQILLAPTAIPLVAGTMLGKITTSGLYVPLVFGASDGSQTFAGILGFSVPANTGNTRTGATVRKGGVNGNKLTYVNAPTTNQKNAIEADAATRLFLFVRY